MDQDHRGKRLKGLNGTDIHPNMWVVLGELFAPTCLDPSHGGGTRIVGPGGGSGPAPGTLGFVGRHNAADTAYLPVWWIGWVNGHDGSGVEDMPKWSTPRSCYWVCPHQLRPPTPDEEAEIVRFLLGGVGGA